MKEHVYQRPNCKSSHFKKKLNDRFWAKKKKQKESKEVKDDKKGAD